MSVTAILKTMPTTAAASSIKKALPLLIQNAPMNAWPQMKTPGESGENAAKLANPAHPRSYPNAQPSATSAGRL